MQTQLELPIVIPTPKVPDAIATPTAAPVQSSYIQLFIPGMESFQ